MVRVLRRDCPPEECELATAEELLDRYGDGVLLPNSIYLCALPASLHQHLAQLNNAPQPLPQISLQGSSFMALTTWLFDVSKASPSLGAAVHKVWPPSPPDEEWAECLRRAAEDRSRPLLLVTPKPAPPKILSVRSSLLVGWESQYEDPLGVVDYIGETLDGYISKWRQNLDYFAAWTMVLQSSGWGKSRSIQELATKGFHVVYVSFLKPESKPESTGYPMRSPVADLLEVGDSEDSRCIAAWVISIISEIGSSTPEEWKKVQLETTFKGKVSQRYRALKAKVTSEVRSESPESLQTWIGNELKILEGSGKVIVCMDEAATLFQQRPESFLAFRRFFSAVPRASFTGCRDRWYLFGVVTDTAGKLGMVFPHRMFDPTPTPQRMFDPSARGTAPPSLFFEPIWVVGSSWRNADRLKLLLKQQQHDLADGVTEDYLRELFKMGRPLWRAILNNNAQVREAVEYAQEKLEGGKAVEYAQQKLVGGKSTRVITEAMATSVLAVAVGLEVAAWCDLAQDMVSGHMRSVTDVSGDRERVFTTDAIEPILGEAAARVLADEVVLLQMLKLLNGVFRQGVVVEEPRGKVAGRMLLVLLSHHCYRKLNPGYSRPLRLAFFLSELCGRGVEADGLIFFNRFMFLNRRKIGQKLLLFCFVSGFAIIPQRNRLAFDVLLPVLMPGDDGKHELRADRMRGFPVQIRNRKSANLKAEKLVQWLGASWSGEGEAHNGEAHKDKKIKLDVQEEAKRMQGILKMHQEPASRDAPPPRAAAIRTQAHQDMLMDHFFDMGDPCDLRPVLEGEAIKMNNPCGLYLHVLDSNKKDDKEGQSPEVKITTDSTVMVLRGMRFPFLKKDVTTELENLCHASHSIDIHSEQGKIVYSSFNNCFKLQEDEKDLLLAED